MSMYRARKHRRRWKHRWPWKLFFPLRVNERFCPVCNLPFQDGPLPAEVASVLVGNVTAIILPAGSFRKHDYVVRFGRWRPSGNRFYCSEYIPASELSELIAAAESARSKLAQLQGTRTATH